MERTDLECQDQSPITSLVESTEQRAEDTDTLITYYNQHQSLQDDEDKLLYERVELTDEEPVDMFVSLSGSDRCDFEGSAGEIEEDCTADSAVLYKNAKNDLAVCERCGTQGFCWSFYGKTKRFCSLSCSRSFATNQREYSDVPLTQIIKPLPLKKPSPPKPKPQINTIPATYNKQNATRSFDWSSCLNTSEVAADVSYFPHAPLSDVWADMVIGMKVEVPNKEFSKNDVYWIATVLRIEGYKTMMRYEGFSCDSSYDFWINLCGPDVHPVGWCAANGRPLIPPTRVQYNNNDWKGFLVRRLTGARTLPGNFYEMVSGSFQNTPFRTGMYLEVVDKMCVSAMRVAKIDNVIGERMRLQYVNGQEDNDDFWCHTKSALIHPVGWSSSAGHRLHADASYVTDSFNKSTSNSYDDKDCTPEIFYKFPDPPNGTKFSVGMKLEAIDPLNLSTICVATVMKVLRNDYLMIGIDGSMAQSGSDWFCYHVSSPSIFPAGFCDITKIKLTPPRGYKGEFGWFDYLRNTQSVAAPVNLFNQDIPVHGFKAGMKIEAVDLMEPRLICVGSIAQVHGRLLRIHFDGWESSYDQWIDCQSPDIYPVGWCEMVGYHLEGPKAKETYVPPVVAAKKRKHKNHILKGPRKRRKNSPTIPSTHRPQRREQWEENNPSGDESANGTPGQDVSLRQDEVQQRAPSTGQATSSQLSIASSQSVDSLNVQSVNTARSNTSFASNSTGVSDVKTTLPNIVDLLLKNQPSPKTMSAPNPVSTNTAAQSLQARTLTSATLTANIITNTAAKSSSIGTLLQTPVHLGADVTRTSTSCNSDTNSSVPISGRSQSWQRSRPYIPKLTISGNSEDNECDLSNQQPLQPQLWDVLDVCQFLELNDCGMFCDRFTQLKVDGERLLKITKEQLFPLTGMRVGPSLKVHELINNLKKRANIQS